MFGIKRRRARLDADVNNTLDRLNSLEVRKFDFDKKLDKLDNDKASIDYVNNKYREMERAIELRVEVIAAICELGELVGYELNYQYPSSPWRWERIKKK